jgi:2-dehydro-3-deoxyphosphogluconate aldolase/(4S)-4-hydroxy-2-oxoglutarate aldolase
MAAALRVGGLRVIEVALRAAGAVEAISQISAGVRDGSVVGAGTVLTAEQADAAIRAGARFVVSPGYSVRVATRCRQRRVPYVPGVTTATEIMAALESGLELLKFFPAEASGGVAVLRALTAPFPSVRWMPTGGIGIENLGAYLDLPEVVAVGGSWMVRPELMDAGRYAEITRLAREAAVLAAPGRAGR